MKYLKVFPVNGNFSILLHGDQEEVRDKPAQDLKATIRKENRDIIAGNLLLE